MYNLTLVREMTWADMMKEFERKYESIENLKNLCEEDQEDMLMWTDLEDWERNKDHPERTVKETVVLFTKNLPLGQSELEMLYSIKHNQPKSIRELSRILKKDIKMVYTKINKLANEGFIELKPGVNRSKIPVVNYDKIEISL